MSCIRQKLQKPNKILQILNVPHFALLTVIFGMMLVSFPMGLFVVFNSDVGGDINFEYPLNDLELFDDLLALFICQFRRSAELLAPALCCCDPFRLSLSDKGALELCKAAQHIKHELLHGVALSVAEGHPFFDKRDNAALGRDLLHQLIEIDDVPGQPVDTMDVNVIAPPGVA